MTVNDLKINAEYYCYLGHKKAFLVRLLGVVQEFDTTELYLNAIERKKSTPIYLNLIDIKDLGIGKTKDQAKRNYSKLEHIPIESSYKSDTLLNKDIGKIRTEPNHYQYFNFKSMDRTKFEIV